MKLTGGASASRTDPFPDTRRHPSRTVSPKPRSRTRTGCHRNDPAAEDCRRRSSLVARPHGLPDGTSPAPSEGAPGSVESAGNLTPFCAASLHSLFLECRRRRFPSLLSIEVLHATLSTFSLSTPTSCGLGSTRKRRSLTIERSPGDVAVRRRLPILALFLASARSSRRIPMSEVSSG
jgi:hypothetical protein